MKISSKPLRMLSLATVLSWASFASSAGVAAVVEVEPNNTLGTAQLVVSAADLIAIDGGRSFIDPSDDFFAFEVRGGGSLQITSSSPDGFADSILGLFDPNGVLVASDDDSGPGFMSAISYVVPNGAVGLYRLGFSGFNPALISCTGLVTACYDTNGDFVFDTFVAGGGSGGSTGWVYTVTVSGVSLVPEPGTWLLLALGLPWLAHRVRARS